MNNPELEAALAAAERARTRFLFGLNKTPDDRLEWNAGGSATSPLQIAGKLLGFLRFLAPFLREQIMPAPPADRTAPATREEAAAAIDEAFREFKEAIAGLSEEDLSAVPQVEWMAPMSLRAWLMLSFQGLGYYQGQLNYVQLAGGDEDPNLPPEWMAGQS